MEDNSNRNSKINNNVNEQDTDIVGETQISDGKQHDGAYELTQITNIKPLKTNYATTQNTHRNEKVNVQNEKINAQEKFQQMIQKEYSMYM